MTTDIYYEDCIPGRVFDLGSRQVTRDEVIEFASEFDPQPFHLDEKAGKASMLGGLAASGWHTAAMMMRLLADGLLLRSSCQGSPGIRKLSWRKPVYPGDTLTAKATILERRELRSRPGLGLITLEVSASNQSGQEVLNQVNPILFAMKNTAPAQTENQ